MNGYTRPRRRFDWPAFGARMPADLCGYWIGGIAMKEWVYIVGQRGSLDEHQFIASSDEEAFAIARELLGMDAMIVRRGSKNRGGLRWTTAVPESVPCPRCEGEQEPGWIEMDNNGPIVECPFCDGNGRVRT